MFEDYYGLPYDNFNLLDFLLASGISPFDPALVGRFDASIPVEQPVIADRIPPEPVFVPSVEPTYTLPAEPVFTPPVLLPAAPEPAPVEPVYTLPTPQPIVAEPAPVEPVYTPPTLLPVAAEPAPAEPVYTLPTPQPVVAEPVPAEPRPAPEPVTQSLPAEQPVVAVPIPVEQSLPTEQPVVAEPVPSWETDPALSGVDWAKAAEALANSNFNLNNFSVLADPGPAYDPNMVYRFDTGSKIGVPKEGGGWEYQNAAPVVFQPGQQYVLTDRSGKNVIARASTPEEMQKLVDLSTSKGDWSLYRADANGNITPGTQLFSKNENLNLGSMLPYMAAIAGTAFGLNALGLGAGAAGAGAGTAAGGTAAGTAAGTAVGTAAAAPIAAGAGTTAGGLGALAPVLGDIVVTGAPAAGIGAGGLAAATAALAAPFAPSLFTNVATNAPASAEPQPNQTISPEQPPAAQPGAGLDEIVVTGSKPPSASLGSILASTAAPFLPTVTTNPTTGKMSVESPEASKPSLLKDILKYYSIGSGVLDALGVGQGGGTSGTATTYTPTLGAVPTFGRGAFQPFTGDYETYAMGPEWSFFNQPTQTAPANAQFPFLLSPATPSA